MFNIYLFTIYLFFALRLAGVCAVVFSSLPLTQQVNIFYSETFFFSCHLTDVAAYFINLFIYAFIYFIIYFSCEGLLRQMVCCSIPFKTHFRVNFFFYSEIFLMLLNPFCTPLFPLDRHRLKGDTEIYLFFGPFNPSFLSSDNQVFFSSHFFPQSCFLCYKEKYREHMCTVTDIRVDIFPQRKRSRRRLTRIPLLRYPLTQVHKYLPGKVL